MKRFLGLSATLICLMALVLYSVAAGSSEQDKTQLKHLTNAEKIIVGLPVTYSATTDANGLLTFTYPNAYIIPPNVQATFTNQTGSNQFFRVQSVTTSSITVYAYQRGILNVALLGDVLAGATTPISGATFDFLVTSKQ